MGVGRPLPDRSLEPGVDERRVDRLNFNQVRKPPDNALRHATIRSMKLEPAICYRAVLARDDRHDGRFFTCVKTTGIYCRPICPARPPRLENCVFVPTAAAAQEAGFRPCLRCRPESSPELAAWRGTSATVARGLRLIDEGGMDENDVETLANRLGVGARHLRRLFRQHLGASPTTVAQTRRVLLAKQLLHQTSLPMADVATASGFGSVRRFNETFQQLYNRPPSELRRQSDVKTEPAAGTSLLLSYQPPYDWSSMLDFLAARALPGVESVQANRYFRTIEIGGEVGSLCVANQPKKSALQATIRFPRLECFPAIVARIRHMFDLGTDPRAISSVLAQDRSLAPSVAARPGLRVPGAWDGLEIAVRAILGQQISVKAATQLAGKMVKTLGMPIESPNRLFHLTHTFPTPARLSIAAVQALGMPRRRAEAIVGLAAASLTNPTLFDPKESLDQAIESFRELAGIGEWTAQYIAMRVLRESDAFPAADVALQRILAVGEVRPNTKELYARAESWRPWRAYAALHLWTSDTPGPSR